MSYEGFVEFLCEQGHYHTCDCNDSYPKTCEVCGGSINYRHSVDTTNGYNEEYPSTCRGPKTEIGFDDRWQEDHYGNRYAVKILRFEPDKTIWVNLVVERIKQAEEERLNLENARWGIILREHTSSNRKGYVKVLSEYDPVTKTFEFTDSVIGRHHYLFTNRIDADAATGYIGLTIKTTENPWQGLDVYPEVFKTDLRYL